MKMPSVLLKYVNCMLEDAHRIAVDVACMLEDAHCIAGKCRLHCLQMPIAPAWAFNAGTFGFCKPISLPELLLTLVYVILSVTLALVGGAAVDVTGYFGFAQVHCTVLKGTVLRGLMPWPTASVSTMCCQ